MRPGLEKAAEVAVKNDEGNFSCGKVLLVTNPSAGRKQEIKRSFLGGIQQLAIAEPIPTPGLSRDDRVARQDVDQTLGRPMVKQNEH
jgi:hypothetical protein